MAMVEIFFTTLAIPAAGGTKKYKKYLKTNPTPIKPLAQQKAVLFSRAAEAVTFTALPSVLELSVMKSLPVSLIAPIIWQISGLFGAQTRCVPLACRSLRVPATNGPLSVHSSPILAAA
jgi:hypothetical protein